MTQRSFIYTQLVADAGSKFSDQPAKDQTSEKWAAICKRLYGLAADADSVWRLAEFERETRETREMLAKRETVYRLCAFEDCEESATKPDPYGGLDVCEEHCKELEESLKLRERNRR